MSDLGARVRELRSHGCGTSEIARRLDVAQSTVHYHLRKAEAASGTPDRAPVTSVGGNARSEVSTRAEVKQLLSQGNSRAEVARRLGISKSTVSYHARRLGEDIDSRCARRYDWRAVQAFHDAGNGVRACIREFGFSSETGHAAVRRGAVVPRSPFMPVDVVFAAATPRNRGHLKRRLLALGLRTGECERCGLHDWRGEPLTMALHHINGDRNDNRLENLQLLCPNCHSQTENFGGRRRAQSREEADPTPSG